MDSSLKLTVTENHNNIPSPEDTKLQLEENFYEKLFIEEMKFRNNPNKANMKNIIRKHCHAVEYFSSIGDDKRAMRYKLLNNIFLNDPQVIQTLDEDNNNIKNAINESKNNLITNILILNQKKNNEKFKENKDLNIIQTKFDFMFNQEQGKLDELIKKKNSFENKIESINLINDEIKTQQNNFKKNLTLKMQKKKSLNENKILQGIKNVLIKGKNKDNKYNNNDNDEEEIEMINNPEINEIPIANIEKKISPIKLDQNYSDKETTTTSNELKFDSNNNNNYSNPLLSSANNKKNTSEFEPLTPINNDKSKKTNEFKSSAKQDISTISEEVNETNDFSLTNNDNITSEENINKKEIRINQVEISSNETKYSNNEISLSNSSINNSINKTLSESKLSNNDLLKSFRLDFNDLFDYIKEHQNANKKTTTFCNDIKNIIENYISDFNQHLSKNLVTKIIKKFSDIWDEMFKKYADITEFFDKEMKQIDFDCGTNNKSNISELSNLIDNINNEKENALNQNEEKFMKEIEKSEIFFKANYNKIDNGILLLNEKFAYVITKRVYDMINNI